MADTSSHRGSEVADQNEDDDLEDPKNKMKYYQPEDDVVDENEEDDWEEENGGGSSGEQQPPNQCEDEGGQCADSDDEPRFDDLSQSHTWFSQMIPQCLKEAIFYVESQEVYQRQISCRLLMEALYSIHESPDDVEKLFHFIDRLSYDTEQRVIVELLDHVVPIAGFCHMKANLRYLVGYRLVPVLARLLLAPDTQVKKHTRECLRDLRVNNYIDQEIIKRNICPVIVDLMCSDDTEHLSGVINLMTKMASVLGREATEECFVPIIISLSKSPVSCIRETCASNLGEYYLTVCKEVAENDLLPCFIELCKDFKWEVRKACAEVIMFVSCACHLETRKNTLAPVCNALLTDADSNVRMAAFETLGPFITTFAEPCITGLAYNKHGQLVLTNWSGFEFRTTPKDDDRCRKYDDGNSEFSDQFSQLSKYMDYTENDNSSLNSGDSGNESSSDVDATGASENLNNFATLSDVQSFKDYMKTLSDNTESCDNSFKENVIDNYSDRNNFINKTAITNTADDDDDDDNDDLNQYNTFLYWRDPLPDVDDLSDIPSVPTPSFTAIMSSLASKSSSISDSNIISVNCSNKSDINRGARDDSSSPSRLVTSAEIKPNPDVDSAVDVFSIVEKSFSVQSFTTISSTFGNIRNSSSNKSNTDVENACDVSTAEAEEGFCWSRSPHGNKKKIEAANKTTVFYEKQAIDLSEFTRQLPEFSRQLPESESSFEPTPITYTFVGLPPYSNLDKHVRKNLRALPLHKGLNNICRKKTTDKPRQNIVPQELIDHFVSLTDPIDGNGYGNNKFLVYQIAYSLPAVAQTLGKENWPLLKNVYQILASDKNWRVRRAVASSIHELAVIIGEDAATQDLVPIFNEIIRDLDEVRIGALKHLAFFLKLLRLAGRNSFLPKLADFLKKIDCVMNWRFRQELAEQLLLMVGLFSAVDIWTHILPVAIILLLDKVAAVRQAALPAVTELVCWVSSDARLLHNILADLAEQFAHSKHWNRRQTFALLCSHFVSQRTLLEDVFAINVLPHLLDLSWDQVPNVRLAVARTLATDVANNEYFSDPHCPHHEVVMQALKRLQADKDRDVQYLAFFKPSYVNTSTQKDNTLLEEST